MSARKKAPVVYVSDRGIRAVPEVRAVYNTVEEAVAQADHDREAGQALPLRVEDEAGQTLHEFE